LPRIYDWGTKTVYFQPQTGKAMDEKAYVGYVYFGELLIKMTEINTFSFIYDIFF
jgi:hypothetical protein